MHYIISYQASYLNLTVNFDEQNFHTDNRVWIRKTSDRFEPVPGCLSSVSFYLQCDTYLSNVYLRKLHFKFLFVIQRKEHYVFTFRKIYKNELFIPIESVSPFTSMGGGGGLVFTFFWFLEKFRIFCLSQNIGMSENAYSYINL